jgi:hypothetical protein
MGTHDRIPSDTTISRHEPPKGVRWRGLRELDIFGQIKEDKHPVNLHLEAIGTLGPPPLVIDADKQTPTPPSLVQ